MSNDDKLKLRQREPRNNPNKELSVVRNIIFWIDIVSAGENTRNVIFARPFNEKNAVPQQLTKNQFHVKSDFHGYGGKSYKCIELKKKLYLIWIDQLSDSIWFQIYEIRRKERSEKKYLFSIQEPRQLSKPIKGNFDSSFVLTEKNFLYGICEIKNRDYLFSLNIAQTKQDIYVIKKFDNFAGELSSNTSSNLLSWIEWDAPYMPWDKNDLFIAQIDKDGDIKQVKKFENKLINFNKNVSFFQPFWISDNLLVCSEDSSGWWNLLFIDVSRINKIIIRKRIERYEYEYGAPQWIAGIKLFSGSIKNLFCLAKKENTWILELYKDLDLVQKFWLPCSSISDFGVFESNVVLKCDGLNFSGYLLEFDFTEECSSNVFKGIQVERVKECVEPVSFWFKGYDNQLTHSLLYKPLHETSRKPPLLLRVHSGPTACFDGSYNKEVQYWTSRGFFVAEVNYGGSSGFGREYRERLNYKWGIVDSYDCNALVIELLNLDLVDREKIAILGNSAGGFTALNSLFFGDIFKAAICKYPVIDLCDMHHNTHRFERNYLNSLIGDYEKSIVDYISRSPINKVSKIDKPILLFHGKKDVVISYKQTLRIQDKLIQNNRFSEVILFENEGHGFKNIENKKVVVQKTDKFLKRVFDL